MTSSANDRPSGAGTRRPLNEAEARYWYMQEARPETKWHVPSVTRIRGPLDPAVLAQCLAHLVERHDALRTKFVVVDGVPMQEIVAPFQPELRRSTVPRVSEDRWEDARLAIVELCGETPDLSRPPWNAHLLTLGENDHVCLLAIEHLVADLDSLQMIPCQIARLYAAITEGKPLPPPPRGQYSQFSDWHREWLQSASAKEQIARGKAQLAGAKPVDVGAGGRLATTSEREGNQRQISLETMNRLDAIVAEEQTRPVALALSAVAIALHQRSGQTDFVFSLVSSYRKAPDTNGIVGNYTNQVPLRIALSPNQSFREVLRTVRQSLVEGTERRDVPTQLLLDTPNPLDHPLAAVAIGLMNHADYGEGMGEIRVAETTMQPMMLGVGGGPDIPFHGGNPHFATLLIRTVRTAKGASLFVTSATEVVPPGGAAALALELTTLLDKVAEQPDAAIDRALA